jgi:predicted SprT family Zn-dependent metalloprotease
MRVAGKAKAADPKLAEQLSAELEATLLRELMRCWHELNVTFFNEALRRPVLRLVDSRSLLGRWDRTRRTIDMSRSMVLEKSWGSVVEVLKHEMAHQYVHEVLDATDETAHGPAFRQVCARIGIDAAASGLPKSDETGRARILERVSALLALAESPNRHEAENAAAAAQRLMLKHNIALSEQHGRQRYAHRQLGIPKGRVQEAEHILAAILADYFFVEAIWVPAYRPLDGKRGNVLEICGTAENLEMAGYVHSFLSGTAERLWRQHKRVEGIRSDRDRRSFMAGAVEGFHERLKSEQRAAKERGMVWVGDADLDRYHRSRHPHIRSVRLRGHGPSEARSHGRAAGRNIVLHRGVKSDSSGKKRRALPAKRRS